MNASVKVSGIPSNLQMRTLIPLFSNILSMRRNDFLLRILPSRGPVKDVSLSLPSYDEAELAQEKLDNFVYKHNNMTYVFTATTGVGYHKQNKRRLKQNLKNYGEHFNKSPDQQYGNWQEEGSGRDRSRSPHYENETSRLDMQIEILRKQRMIIEEERKLLEEQRKLDQLKMQSFSNNIPSVLNRTYDDNQTSEPFSNSSEKNVEHKQPSFYQASGVLLRKMYVFINEHSSPEERKALMSHLRSILKQRMAQVVAADGKGVFKTHKVIVLYRTVYPETEDEELVKQAIDDVRQGRVTEDTTVVKKPTESVNRVESDTIKSSADEKTLQEKAIAKDTANSGGETNISDTAKNDDNTKVKKSFERKRLYFHKSSGVLIRKANVFMDLYCPPEKRKLLVEYLRYKLKQRLAAVVDDKPIYQTHRIIKLYRTQYPSTDDEGLVKQLVEDIEEGRVPDEVFLQHTNKKASVDENTADVEDTTGESKTTAETKDEDSYQDQHKENADVSKDTEKEQLIEEKNVDITDDDSQKKMDSVDIKKDIVELTTKEENSPEKEENKSDANNIVSTEISSLDNDSKLDNDTKDNMINTETSQNGSNENNHGIKRKNEEIENLVAKIPKADNFDVIDTSQKCIEKEHV